MPTASGLNESHRRRLLANAQHADKLLSDIEGILQASESKSPFPKYRPDVNLQQDRLIRSHISRFRDHLSRVLRAVGVEPEGARLGALHSLRVTLAFVRIAVQEMAPEHLRGYGDLSADSASELRGLCGELEGLIDSLERSLALGAAADLGARLERLQQTTNEAALLRTLENVIGEEELTEFRAPLQSLVEKLELPVFEIAVFGRVSSGKSSLLNHVLGADVLPVGVNPITTVPTRLVYAETPSLAVSLADGRQKRHPIADLAQYASEEQNPGNRLGVSRLVVALPSPRLQDGLVLVDTPGLGALATAAAAETWSYLPQCDLGILLINAASPIGEEDLSTIRALFQAGIPVMALLSKADLLTPGDRRKAMDYTKKEVLENLGIAIEIDPVSTLLREAELLENWFRQRLAPLYARHRELARQSIQRKSGALRESVMAALDSKLGTAAPEEPEITASFEEVERQLRAAAGVIEQTRRFCLDASYEVRSLSQIALRRSVESVLESWDALETAGPACTEQIREVSEKLAAEAASQIAGRLRSLARQLQDAVTLAAEALRSEPNPLEGHLGESVREMPRFEAALPEIAVAPPWFQPSRSFTRGWLARKLDRAAGAELQTSFDRYGRGLEAWVRRVAAELQSGFDARADSSRAQIARLISRKSLSHEERTRLERHLAELADAAAVTQTPSARPSEAAET